MSKKVVTKTAVFERSDRPGRWTYDRGPIGGGKKEFFKSKDEKDIIKNVITELQIENIYEKTIVTEISLMNDFYLAESLHKSFYENNLKGL